MCFSLQVPRNLAGLKERFRAGVWGQRYRDLTSPALNPYFTLMKDDDRIFPGYMCHVLLAVGGQRLFAPMRYRLRPAGSAEEVPSRFNLFNARLETLTQKSTWKRLVGKKHALIPFHSFYEWVDGDAGKKKLINIKSSDLDLLFAPALYDEYTVPETALSFFSFALITTAPPPDILAMGHDRAPLLLQEDKIDDWLACRTQPHQLLTQISLTHYTGQFNEN